MKKKYITLSSIIIIITLSFYVHSTYTENYNNKTVLNSPTSPSFTEFDLHKKTNEILKEQRKLALQKGYIKKYEINKNNKSIEYKNKKPAEKTIEINGLVPLEALSKDFVIELRYASTNNFTEKKVYPVDICVIRKETGKKLIKANNILLNQGYRIKILDAYRPFSVQKIFWNIVKGTSKQKYVANPNKSGSRHNSGAAVDITLVDMNGQEITMPSNFDDFSKKAWRNNSSMSKEAKRNLDILTKAMKESGFNTINSEWWHYEDSNYNSYPKKLDISLDKFVK